MNTWASLMQHGGHIQLNKSWAKPLAEKVSHRHLKEIQENFQVDIQG